MDVIGLLWKLSYMVHVVSNASFFGASFMMFVWCEVLCESKTLSLYKKYASFFLILSFLSGIGLLSIMSMGGMDDLTSNSVGISILWMIAGFSVVVFTFIFLLLYKGGDKKIEKILLTIIIFSYLFVYLLRVYLVH